MQSINVTGLRDPQLKGTLQDDPAPAEPGRPGFWDSQGGWIGAKQLKPLVARLPSTADVPPILFDARDGSGYEVYLFATDTLEYTTLEGAPMPGPPPELTALSSTSATIGGPDVLLRVEGTGFLPGALITFNGTPEVTTMAALETVINMATATTPGSYPVTVRNYDGQESAPLMFTLEEAPTRSQRRSSEEE